MARRPIGLLAKTAQPPRTAALDAAAKPPRIVTALGATARSLHGAGFAATAKLPRDAALDAAAKSPRIATFTALACTLLACALLAFALAATPAERAFAEDGSTASESKTTAEVDRDEANIVDPSQRADNTFIYDTTINAVLSESSLYEGRTVQVVGEAIGDCISAGTSGEYVWVTVATAEEESEVSVSVLMTAEQAKQIDHYGRYGVTGTTVQVRGTFNQACQEHEGLIDIHASSVGIVARGSEHPDEFNMSNFWPGILAVLVGLALIAAFNIARERMR